DVTGQGRKLTPHMHIRGAAAVRMDISQIFLEVRLPHAEIDRALSDSALPSLSELLHHPSSRVLQQQRQMPLLHRGYADEVPAVRRVLSFNHPDQKELATPALALHRHGEGRIYNFFKL